MDEQIMYSFLLALNSPEGRIRKFKDVFKTFGEEQSYLVLKHLINNAYIVGLIIDTVADGSKMFNITTQTAVTPKGICFIEDYNRA
ncbi:MAG TPA: hypothetical protein DCM73_04400 [Clostridiales bacterium]|nr:hypothetical protein [Clostridiales bacterium]